MIILALVLNMAVRVVEFSSRARRVQNLKDFALESTYPEGKLLNFEFCINGEPSKIGHHLSNKVIKKLILSKNVNNK